MMDNEKRIGSSSTEILYAGTWDDGENEVIDIYIKDDKAPENHDSAFVWSTSSFDILIKAHNLYNRYKCFDSKDQEILNDLVIEDAKKLETNNPYLMDADFTENSFKLTLAQNGSPFGEKEIELGGDALQNFLTYANDHWLAYSYKIKQRRKKSRYEEQDYWRDN